MLVRRADMLLLFGWGEHSMFALLGCGHQLRLPTQRCGLGVAVRGRRLRVYVAMTDPAGTSAPSTRPL